MRSRKFNQQGSKVLKNDLTNLLPPEVLDKTRATEKMVLGAILNHQDTVNDQMKLVLDEGVQAEDFSIPRIGALFETMMESYQSRNEGDFLEEVLRNRHYKDEAYSNFLMQVMDEGDLIRNTSLTFHARALKNLSFERQEINLIAQIGSKLQQGEPVSESYELLDKLREAKAVYRRGEKGTFVNGLEEWWKDFDVQRSEGFKDDLEIKTHLPSLEEETQGLRKSEVSVLAGSPGSGKSALAMNLILAAVNGSKVKTSLISLEMTVSEIMSRLIVQMTNDVPLKVFLDPSRLQPNQWSFNEKELERILTEIEKARNWTNSLPKEEVFDAKALNAFKPEIVLKTVENSAQSGSDLIILDHIHRILFKERGGNLTEEMTRLMVSLTEIAKSYSCHILALSQLNRESSREGRKPRLTDLKGSGGIEENASLAMFLSRDLDSKEAILSFLKARSGRSGWSIPMVFNPKRLTFVEQYNL